MGTLTDELREYVIDADGLGMSHSHAKSIYAIADRIDAEAEDNERFRREAEPFCDRLREAAAERADVTLFGVDYTALPLDADGAPLHLGDLVEGLSYEDGTVTGIQYGLDASGAIRELVAVRPHGWDTATWHDPEEYRHHHAPTVEDVLREFAEKVIDSQIPNVHPTYDEAIAEYAAKLRLAEEVDE